MATPRTLAHRARTAGRPRTPTPARQRVVPQPRALQPVVRRARRRALRPRATDPTACRRGRSLTLLDIGTGSATFRGTRCAGPPAGPASAPFGLERSRIAARLAGAAAVPSVVGCAGALPFRRPHRRHRADEPGGPSSRRGRGRRALPRRRAGGPRRRRARRPAPRPPGALLGFRVGARLLGFDRVTRVDGVTSVARGYSPAELTALAARAGVEAHVTGRPGYRVVAWWRTG